MLPIITKLILCIIQPSRGHHLFRRLKAETLFDMSIENGHGEHDQLDNIFVLHLDNTDHHALHRISHQFVSIKEKGNLRAQY